MPVRVIDFDSLWTSLNVSAVQLPFLPWIIRRWIQQGKIRKGWLSRRVLAETGELKRLVQGGRKGVRPNALRKSPKGV
jgi:hypothetical protein